MRCGRYPLRLRTAVKLSYKNAKWIKAIEVTNTFRETFWSRQGENWFAGFDSVHPVCAGENSQDGATIFIPLQFAPPRPSA